MPPRPTSGSIWPNSTAERARLTKLVQPESTAQKCPRCESTNTKFCYYNNYSLSQPRYFCKMCRRYWTRGGALRNVPVGGGCRRNKKNKTSARSKSTPVITGSSSTSGISSSSCTTEITGHVPLTRLPQFPFSPPLHDHISNFGAGDHIGFSFGGVQPPATMTACGGTGGFGDHRQQFPFLAGLEPPSAAGMYQFKSEVCDFSDQIAVVTFEENQELNLPKKFLGFPGNDQQCWSIANALTDINGFTSSSANNFL